MIIKNIPFCPKTSMDFSHSISQNDKIHWMVKAQFTHACTCIIYIFIKHCSMLMQLCMILLLPPPYFFSCLGLCNRLHKSACSFSFILLSCNIRPIEMLMCFVGYSLTPPCLFRHMSNS